MKRTSLTKSECPVARSLDVIGDWSSLLLVRDAFDGVRRFGDFQRNLGIAKGMLTARLRDLVARGVMDLVPAADGSVYQEYVLTERGRGLFLVVVALRQWGEEHLFARGESHSTLVETANGQTVGRLELRARDGHVLVADDTCVRKVGTASKNTRKHAGAAASATSNRPAAVSRRRAAPLRG